MKKSAIVTALLLFPAVAVAQESPYSQTLDEQLQRVRAGKPAVPMAGQKAATAPVATPAAPVPPAQLPIAYDRFGQPIHSEGGGAIPALPLQPMVSGDIQFVTGGVGDEELDQLKSIELEYNVRLLVSAKDGEYLSGCTLYVIDDKNVTLLATDNAGPYFYAKMKPGKYTLDVTTSQGANQKVKITVPAKGELKQTVRFDV